jgi:hypothetical protein
VRLPVPSALLAAAFALRRTASPVVAALRDARAAATMAEPEPISGASRGVLNLLQVDLGIPL